MHILTDKGATVMLDGRPRLVSRHHPQWEAILHNLDSPEGLRRLLDPNTKFAVGQVWRTRSGGEAVVTLIAGPCVTVEVDGCFEITTTGGEITPGFENDDDLIERTDV
jgi:hypothetical protein